jgi:hypothetical protein
VSGIWLVQWHGREVDHAVIDGDTVLTPALGRHVHDIAIGDPVVLWRAGSCDESGVWALGEVSSGVYQSEHQRDESGKTPRPTVDVTLTHLLDDRMIVRSILRADRTFADFRLFKRGGARGTNPHPVTAEQWAAIRERVPYPAALDRPASRYQVAIDFLITPEERAAVGAALRKRIVERRYDELSFEAARVGQATLDWEYCDAPVEVLPAANQTIAASWTLEVEATTARRAFIEVFRRLCNDPDPTIRSGTAEAANA